MNTEPTAQHNEGTLEPAIRLDQRTADMLRRCTEQMNELARAEPEPAADWTLETIAQLLLADALDEQLHG